MMKTIFKLLMLIPVFQFCGLCLRAGEADSCKVLFKEISGTYKGDCKDGLAHGKGKAVGEDTYNGEFKNGLPDGKGKYTYKDGNMFLGHWVNGLKQGEGKFTYYTNGKANVLEGFWQNGEYVGKTSPEEMFRVTNQTGIGHYSIKKTEGDDGKISIAFYSVNVKYVPTDLKVTATNGQVHQDYKNVSVTEFNCPVTVSIYFTIKSQAGAKQCFLFFDILKPGNYEVTVSDI